MTIADIRANSSIEFMFDYSPASQPALNVTWLIEPVSKTAIKWSPVINAALSEIKRDCSHDNWDGENAYPISAKTIAFAEAVSGTLYCLLPHGTPIPDVIPEPDGEICLSWVVSDRNQFSISIGEHGKLNFAGQRGKKGAIHGWQPVDKLLPRALEESLQDVSRFIAELYSHSK